MKKKNYLLKKPGQSIGYGFRIAMAVLFIGVFGGCSSSSQQQEQDAPTLQGTWKLINVRGGFAGVNDSFTPGQILWNIDTANHTVTVSNNNTNPNMQDILASGTYNYLLQNDPNGVCSQVIKVHNMDLGCYNVSPNQLVITYEYADGFTLTLIR